MAEEQHASTELLETDHLHKILREATRELRIARELGEAQTEGSSTQNQLTQTLVSDVAPHKPASKCFYFIIATTGATAKHEHSFLILFT